MKRQKGVNFDEAIFADDTILVSECLAILQKDLHSIEKIDEWYGMKLNGIGCYWMVSDEIGWYCLTLDCIGCHWMVWVVMDGIECYWMLFDCIG